MTWRTAIGFKPTSTDLAQDLLKAAERHGLTGWQHDATDDVIRNGDHVINLANIHLEYAAASRLYRRNLLQKYFAMLQTTPVPKLWTLAQTKIFPLLRSRYDLLTPEIASRRKQEPFPPRAARRFIGSLDQILGYDHGQTVSQVPAATLEEWAAPIDAVIDRALNNLRALPAPTWLKMSPSVWKLESDEGYNESFLQLPKVFESLPAKGTPIAMIPNRGVLLASGIDEPSAITALLAEARKSLQEAPWPLCGDLFRIGSNGIQLFVPSGTDAKVLASIQRLDIESVYAAQKTALEAHCEAIHDDVFVATYGLLGQKNDPTELQSWCSWTQGVLTLLPTTDLIAFVWDLSGSRKTALVPWANAAAIAGHYFKSTAEDPPRTRVDEFPNAAELVELQKHVI
jgi:hypothetical protein